jgi:3-oxoacyl-[acyl-carrier-protein] synthase-3
MGTLESAYTDKTTYPLFSDVGSATALEYDESAPAIWCDLGTIGTDYNSIIIPDGGARNPTNDSSLELVEYEKNIKRTKLNVNMKGMEVFSFALETAPKSLENVLRFAGKEKSDVDLFLFHQANYYMVKKIIKKLRIDQEKAPFSMLNFGNTGSSSIPITMITERREDLMHLHSRNCACAFGAGLSWGSLYFETDNLVLPEIFEYHG